jgi:5-methylcytosine-specific restriction endonuclease McrA
VKTCSTCKETKDRSEFSKASASKDGLQSRCKSCAKAYHRSDAYKKSRDAYHKSEKGRAATLRARKSPAGRVAQARYNESEKGKARSRKWVQSEKGKLSCQKRNSERRARLLGAPGFHNFKAITDLYEDKCALCGRDDVPMTVGHIIPLSRGGDNWAYNIRPECKSCNSSKHDKLDHEQVAH